MLLLSSKSVPFSLLTMCVRVSVLTLSLSLSVSLLCRYVPYVGDSKRAMDEYTSEIFMGGKNTIVMHNTCEDSLLASPLIFDLAIITELCQRIQIQRISSINGDEVKEKEFETFHPVLSLLSYLMKAPLVPPGTPVVNALAAQRQCIVNVMKACVGLPPDNYMTLEHKVSNTNIHFSYRIEINSLILMLDSIHDENQ